VKQQDSQFKAGMYLLETLTSGMYNEPLSIYREYIQNSVDAIDQLDEDKRNEHKISIDLNPFNRQIKISDNGAGISSEIAKATLSSIGSSNKVGTQQRGFRGIGRLGGIAFAKKVIFKTKAQGEQIESMQEWDCSKLRDLLANPSDALMSLGDIFQQVTTFSQTKSQLGINKSFFEVTLDEVASFKNHIFDIAKIREYLCQVAPLRFDYEQFTFAPYITNYLKKNLDHFCEYQILLNGEAVYQSYKNIVRTTSKNSDDCIEGIETFEIKPNGKVIAFGWHAKRRNLLGAIHKGDKFSGIRVKVGNIMIGDQHLLDRCFREIRFNGYVFGEIHICDEGLVPNSRRDDFVDNKLKNLFYNEVEKVVGVPISKEIRLRSRLRSETIAKERSVNASVALTNHSSEIIDSANQDLSEKDDRAEGVPCQSISNKEENRTKLTTCDECSLYKKYKHELCP
jgi:hypothetical protein